MEFDNTSLFIKMAFNFQHRETYPKQCNTSGGSDSEGFPGAYIIVKEALPHSRVHCLPQSGDSIAIHSCWSFSASAA